MNRWLVDVAHLSKSCPIKIANAPLTAYNSTCLGPNATIPCAEGVLTQNPQRVSFRALFNELEQSDEKTFLQTVNGSDITALWAIQRNRKNVAGAPPSGLDLGPKSGFGAFLKNSIQFFFENPKSGCKRASKPPLFLACVGTEALGTHPPGIAATSL